MKTSVQSVCGLQLNRFLTPQTVSEALEQTGKTGVGLYDITVRLQQYNV